MRLFSVRLIVSLILGVTLVSLGSSYLEMQSQKADLRQDLERRAEMMGESLAGNVGDALEKSPAPELQRIMERFGNREHLMGVAVYDRQGDLRASTPGFAQLFATPPPAVAQAMSQNNDESAFLRLGNAPAHVYVLPLHHKNNDLAGGLMIVHDASYIRDQIRSAWRQKFLRVLLQVLVIMLITLLIVRWSITGPIASAAQWMRGLRTGRNSSRQFPSDLDFLRPLAHEATTLADSLNRARSAAEKEARLRDAAESLWTAERLAAHLRTRLESSRLFVVSNREPYVHVHRGKSVEATIPASGLVTALEPVLRACDGTWIAHGSGDADREVVDRHDRLRVPPDEPRYTLRRVWLNKEEEEGYYYGFSNEGIWPLCHIAHTRPLFRTADWEHYRDVNRKFAEAVTKEMEGVEHPVVLVQDYHFALLPRLIKQSRPDARVAIFWHIPWPNPEAFGICPWQRELLDGLLGADLVGFHVQSHCTNFLQTVDRALESRIDWEHFSVKRRDHRTLVRPFPISVDAAEPESPATEHAFMFVDRPGVLAELGVDAIFLGVGVDRVDYTKGILERFLAVERLLEKYPQYGGQLTFVQIGAPSRTRIKRYRDLLAEVEVEAERINQRFHTAKWKPIIFLNRHHTHDEIQRFYNAADFCLVTSLHDGMNLVAKEFVAARHDDQGALILSRFTGAARELRDAVLVNPYDIDQTAEAIRFALEMDPEERKARMQRLRKNVREHNIYRWAGNLVAELCEVRLETAHDPLEEGARMGSSAA